MGAGGRRGTHPLAMPNSQNDARNRWLTPFSCGLGAAQRGVGVARGGCAKCKFMIMRFLSKCECEKKYNNFCTLYKKQKSKGAARQQSTQATGEFARL